MNDRRRALPAVNTLLDEAEAAGLTTRAPRRVVVDAVRAALAQARASGGRPPDAGWLHAIEQRISEQSRRSLRRVVNATGVVLHTNLGRAPLAAVAKDAVEQVLRYSTLELQLDTGARGSRQDHLRRLLGDLTGAEDALVVVNAAAALLLVLNTVAHDGETIVSRGELVEIGGAFRIPEILAKSGTVLAEVGTTNRTRLGDYESALNPRTKAVLKVHQSNFQVSGFVEDVPIADLVALGAARGLPAIHDVGSGLLISLESFGLRGEPLVRDSAATGATVIFSGDKLLGGPQAGIIVGPAEVVRAASDNPMARALRPDKTIIAALEATLELYRDPERARAEIPTLAMLTADAGALKRRARRLARRFDGAALSNGVSAVGGGAFPGCELPTTLVTVAVQSCDSTLASLRAFDPPVIARASDDKVVLDVRTITDDEFAIVADALREAADAVGG